VIAGTAAAILFSRVSVVGEAIQHPPPGLAALAQHAFLLGNWHVLAYAAIGLALLASPTWRAPALLPASGSVALGLIAVLAFCTTVSGSSLLGTTGAIGNATMPWAPVLALWTALVAHGWLERSRAARPAGVQDVAPPADALRTARPTDAAG
jgi:hypothetical protein